MTVSGIPHLIRDARAAKVGLAMLVLTQVLSWWGPVSAEEGGVEEPRTTIGIGPGIAPEYVGANEYSPIPFIVARRRWGARYSVGTDGTGVRADIIRYRFVEAGPALGFQRARDGDVDDAVIARLPEVDFSIELGGYVALNFPFLLTAHDKDALTIDATFLQDVAGGHEGYLVRLALFFRGLVTDKLALQTGPFAHYGSDDFVSAYFDVTAAGAMASGLPSFDAQRGFTDIGLRFAGRYMFNEHWNLNFSVSGRRFIKDAKQSPIIRIRGSEQNFFGGFAVGYSF